MKNIFTLNTANLDKYASGDPRQALVDLFDKGYLQEDPSNRPNSPRVSYRLTFQAEGILGTELSKRREENLESKREFSDKIRSMEDPMARRRATTGEDSMRRRWMVDPPRGYDMEDEGWEHPEWDN